MTKVSSFTRARPGRRQEARPVVRRGHGRPATSRARAAPGGSTRSSSARSSSSSWVRARTGVTKSVTTSASSFFRSP